MKITINLSGAPVRNIPAKMPALSFWLVMGGIYLLAWMTQAQSILNSDVSWMIIATQRLWKGGTYSQNFFEVNPPMILQVYSPIVFLKIFFRTDIALRVYVFLLASMSLLLCYPLLRKICITRDNFHKYIFLFSLAGIFLLLPQNDFGQREHCMLIMTMPYFLLAVCRMENNNFPSRKFLMLIGILAGFGFAIKPYFFLAFLLVELYLMYGSRRLMYVLRTEVLAIIAVQLFYIFTLATIFHDYVTVVMPLILQNYYQKYRLPIGMLLSADQAFYYYFALVFYLIRFKENSYESFSTVLLLAATGFFISFLIQGSLWPYHALPLIAFSIFLFTVLFCQLITQAFLSTKNLIICGAYAGVFFLFLFWKVNYIQLSILFYPAAYFCLFAVIFALLLATLAPNSFLKNTAKTVVVISIACLFYADGVNTYLHAHIFLMTSVLLMLSIGFFILRLTPEKSLRFGVLMLLGLIIFAYPFQQMGSALTYTQAYKKLYGNLTRMLNRYPHQSVLLLSTACELTYPALDFSQHDLATRFACLGWLPGMDGKPVDYKKLYAESKTRNSFLINALVEDLEKNQPDIIFVDIRNLDPKKPRRYFGSQQMDYLKFFSQNSSFAEVMKKYRYVKTEDGQPLYRFELYQKRGDE